MKITDNKSNSNYSSTETTPSPKGEGRVGGRIRLGKRNLLKILRIPDHGAYLDGGEIGDILLPKRYLPEGAKVGDEVDVFLYLDQDERLIATTQHPLIEVGQFAFLECKWVNQYGAFLDWGLMKDLFCPFREQKIRMEVGKRYQVYCYIDDLTYRIVCTSKIDKLTAPNPEVPNSGAPNPSPSPRRGRVTNENAANTKRSHPSTNERSANTKRSHPSPTGGRAGLGASRASDRTILIDDFEPRLFAYIKDHDGFCPFHDKSDAEDIYREFGVSKKVFKQAVGGLYKKEFIKITTDGLYLTAKGAAEGCED